MDEALSPKEMITGCNRKCPCRVWVQCRYYNRQKWLGFLKGMDIEKRYVPLHEWYDLYFKAQIEMPLAAMNG
jgi:hypothetical protein